jgi:hypothetical protein
MQTDVRSVRITQSGWMVKGSTRVKGISVRGGNGSGTGRATLFDTAVAPTSATYAQSGYTVTVTSVAHGLKTGAQVGICYYPTSGQASATNGNYTITVTGANTFTITDINSTTVTAGTVCVYTANGLYMHLMAIENGDIYNNYQLCPGQGIRAVQNVYGYMDSGEIDSIAIYYG